MSKARLLRFIIPSLMGVMMFMTPVVINGSLMIPIVYLIELINGFIKPYMLEVSVAVAVIPSILTAVVSFNSRLKAIDNRFLQLLNPGMKWTIIRLLGAATMLLVYFQVGPEWIWDRDTGGVLLYDVAPVVLAMFFVSSVLLPLLTDYGLMEFISVLVHKIFSRIFGLPGRAAIDCLTSWLSDSTVGVILTTQQYRNGYYTKREAAVIASSYSIVSIAFSYIVLKFVSMEHVFFSWYFSVAVSGVVCAMIVPRLIPLKNVPNTYFSNRSNASQGSSQGENESHLRWAVRRGVERADRAESPARQVMNGIHAATDVAITIYPAMMLLGVIGLSIIKYTTVIQFLATPLVPYLELLQLPEASVAATAIMTGFIDLLMPVILAEDIESELTRFVIAGVAVNGIIYLTEVAIIILKANIGLNILHLFAIWLIRLIISLPVMTALGHLFVV
ncbi:arginine uptake transporter [Oceanisphaera psychrotolerans]|uniref:Arginine uptake transporter n=2 Tax=Oceanisphaera psychrotolerans TaxID=1414654 RepID=A0A1J4QAN9_9GAMM|nr:arginine uptake transporter [Oceanisphaera psychrotolerans]